MKSEISSTKMRYFNKNKVKPKPVTKETVKEKRGYKHKNLTCLQLIISRNVTI